MRLIIIFLFLTPIFASAESRFCRDLFSSSSVSRTLVDDLFSHIHLVHQLAPHRSSELNSLGLGPQVLANVRHLFGLLEDLRGVEAEILEVNRVILDVQTSMADIAGFQAWLVELQAQARSLRAEYLVQKKRLVNFMRVHNAYPKFEGIFVDIHLIEGPTQSEKFLQLLKRVYEAYAFQEGWLIEIKVEKSNHVRLLVRSEQALSRLMGEIGVHSWNTVQGELGSGVLRSEGGDKEKRRMIKARVTMTPFVNFHYRMNPQDVRIQSFNSASGNGGQKRNKTSSDVRASHGPSGLVVEVTEFRTMVDNRRVALERLEERVIEHYRQLHEADVNKAFWSVQAVDTHRTVRTYHLKENRITGLQSSRFVVRAASLDDISPSDIFASIDTNANIHFESQGNQYLESILHRLLVIEREILRDLDSGISSTLQRDIDRLISVGLRSLDEL